ncbi:MAG: hypothetical protein ACK40G_16160 [Cytophagaceae bacterium]
MKYLDDIFDKLVEYDKNNKKLPFPEDDFRKAYFELTFSCLYQYYKAFCWIYFAELANSGKIGFSEEIEKSFEKHRDQLLYTVKDNNAYVNTRNSANRSLIIESWSIFEFCITSIATEILTEKDLDELLSFQSIDFLKLIKKYSLSDDDIAKINKKFKKGHLTHVPINRKYNRLYSKFQEYIIGDIESDKKFLTFFGKYRNCVHSNYIYHGEDDKCNFNGIECNRKITMHHFR